MWSAGLSTGRVKLGDISSEYSDKNPRFMLLVGLLSLL